MFHRWFVNWNWVCVPSTVDRSWTEQNTCQHYTREKERKKQKGRKSGNNNNKTPLDSIAQRFRIYLFITRHSLSLSRLSRLLSTTIVFLSEIICCFQCAFRTQNWIRWMRNLLERNGSVECCRRKNRENDKSLIGMSVSACVCSIVIWLDWTLVIWRTIITFRPVSRVDVLSQMKISFIAFLVIIILRRLMRLMRVLNVERVCVICLIRFQLNHKDKHTNSLSHRHSHDVDSLLLFLGILARRDYVVYTRVRRR